MTDEDMDFIIGMQKRGFAIVVFTPEELENGLSAKNLELRLIRYGQDLLDSVREPE
jgi:hypothetical protein